jgi:hypothetical protein
MESNPELEFALRRAWRNEPGPLSAVFVTKYVAPVAGSAQRSPQTPKAKRTNRGQEAKAKIIIFMRAMFRAKKSIILRDFHDIPKSWRGDWLSKAIRANLSHKKSPREAKIVKVSIDFNRRFANLLFKWE